MKFPVVLSIILGLSCNLALATDEFLQSIESGFESTHGLKYRFSSGQLSATDPLHRADQFGENPYQISLAAFIGESQAVMIHAERVANGSGASNYDSLPAAEWPDASFRSPGAVCIDVPESEVEGEHDLEWLRANGFDPVGPMIFVQYFASTADYNDEIVVSLLARADACPSARPIGDWVESIQETVDISTLD